MTARYRDSQGTPLGVYDRVTTSDGRTGEVSYVVPDVPFYRGKVIGVGFFDADGSRMDQDSADGQRGYRPEHLTVTWRHPNNMR